MTDHDLLLQIVHKLDHMATKEDIVNFATKDDLRASIDEVKAEFNDKLANFATKDDLANFATKRLFYAKRILMRSRSRCLFSRLPSWSTTTRFFLSKNYLIWRPVWRSWKHRPVNPSCIQPTANTAGEGRNRQARHKKEAGYFYHSLCNISFLTMSMLFLEISICLRDVFPCGTRQP